MRFVKNKKAREDIARKAWRTRKKNLKAKKFKKVAKRKAA